MDSIFIIIDSFFFISINLDFISMKKTVILCTSYSLYRMSERKHDLSLYSGLSHLEQYGAIIKQKKEIIFKFFWNS